MPDPRGGWRLQNLPYLSHMWSVSPRASSDTAASAVEL